MIIESQTVNVYPILFVVIAEALKGMEKVAEHINEMQRIHEEYGAIFDHLFRQHQKSCKQPIDLSPGKIVYLDNYDRNLF